RDRRPALERGYRPPLGPRRLDRRNSRAPPGPLSRGTDAPPCPGRRLQRPVSAAVPARPSRPARLRGGTPAGDHLAERARDRVDRGAHLRQPAAWVGYEDTP